MYYLVLVKIIICASKRNDLWKIKKDPYIYIYIMNTCIYEFMEKLHISSHISEIAYIIYFHLQINTKIIRFRSCLTHDLSHFLKKIEGDAIWIEERALY